MFGKLCIHPNCPLLSIYTHQSAKILKPPTDEVNDTDKQYNVQVQVSMLMIFYP